ncbi:Uncharacterized membrane protein [Methanolobus vulcani]|jgi:uncharacterized membrane protein|uniref:Uncharacterized membrane protein n=1 Tax=Methanolobus vulcani TaxID=38026 RepID=A0A7Z7B3V6_9EURY|nr:DUF4870 domain-containing protein [Methanolobus vulcani]SDG35905.1 Uncharacterized membrane protein [Methanolobus vulcani]
MSETNLGVSENIAGVLAYLFGLVSGILILVIEKENTFARFHAAQSSVLCIATIVLSIFIMIVGWIPIIGWLIALLSIFVYLAIFVLWLFLMFKAFSGEMYRLPVLADYADQLEGMF